MADIRGLIFDLGNTLMYLDNDWDLVVNQGAKELAEFLVRQRLKLEPARFASDFVSLRESMRNKARQEQVEYTADRTLLALLAQLGYKEVSQELIEGAMDALFSFEEAFWRPYPEAEATLRQLSNSGYRLAVISNATYDPLIQRLVDKGRLRGWFDIVLSSAGEGIRKPHPDIFQKVLDHWGFSPSQVVMVGDFLQFDILGAHNAGLRGILAAWDLYPDYDAGGDGVVPDATARSFSQLIEVIATLDEQTTEGDQFLP